jgi:hypothetical protein
MFGDRPIRGIVDLTEGGLIAALGSKVDPFLPIRWIATVQLLVAVSGIISLRGIYEGLYLSTDFTIPILACANLHVALDWPLCDRLDSERLDFLFGK